MPSQSLDAFFRSLPKAEPARAYYFHGPEDLLKDEALRAILDRTLDPSLRDFNLDQRSAGQLDADGLFALCTTLPMMAERRVVVLREVEGIKRKPKLRAALLEYLGRPAPDTVLVLIQGANEEAEDREIARAALTVACEALPEERVLKWLDRRAKGLGVELPEDASRHLVRAVGGELASLAAELEKLAALPAGRPLSVERVGELVGVRHGETVFDWRDAVLEDRPGPAVHLLGPLLDQPGNSGVKLVTILGTTLIGVGIARSYYDSRLRGRALDEVVFGAIKRNRVFGLLGWGEEKARWLRWAPAWPAGRLAEALRSALIADRALKFTSISDERGILTDLVLRMATSKRAAA
ncbi:MAG TPA: DNA polymerase III subunit delta [Gemmatimonadales bacterium]|nr:DNA polymerase III subunit delta [Gemmatimonadales bacterium]